MTYLIIEFKIKLKLPIDVGGATVVGGAMVVGSPGQGAGAGILRLLHFHTRSLIRVTYVLVEHKGCSKMSITEMMRPIFDP